MKAAAILSAVLVAFVVGMISGNALAFQPRLVGFGCEGAAGPLFAIEESDFPQCEAIENAAPIFTN